MGTAALVLGILALVGSAIPGVNIVSIVMAVLGGILAVVAMSRVSKRVATNRGASAAALVLNILAIVVAIIALIVTAAFVGAVDEEMRRGAPREPVPSAAGSAESEPEASQNEQQFPGQTADDVVAEPGGMINLGDLAVTATALGEQSSEFGGDYLCATVSYVNESDQQVMYNLFDWSLQNPDGAIVTATISGRPDELTSGQLAPGGRAEGEVCFEATGATGTHVLLAESLLSLSSGRAAWVNEL